MDPLRNWQSELPRMLHDQDPEDLHLDYKEKRYLLPLTSGGGIDKQKRADDLSKDVSAFLNSDGGTLICGIREDRNSGTSGGIPAAFDSNIDGYQRGDITKETLENIITSNIQPKIDASQYCITEAEVGGRIVVAIDVAKSYRGAYQAKDKLYYKRFQFKSEPMDHYEIEDIRNRSIGPDLSVVIALSDKWELEIPTPSGAPGGIHTFSLYTGIRNNGVDCVSDALIELGVQKTERDLRLRGWDSSLGTKEVVLPDGVPRVFIWFELQWAGNKGLFKMIHPTRLRPLSMNLAYGSRLDLRFVWRIQAPNMYPKSGGAFLRDTLGDVNTFRKIDPTEGSIEIRD